MSLQDLELLQQEKILESNIPADFWKSFAQAKTFELSSRPEKISYLIDANVATQTYSLEELNTNDYNCDSLQRGKAQIKHQEKKLELSASNGGIACFDTVLGTRTSVDHIFLLEGQNKAGKTLEFSLFNPELSKVEATVAPAQASYSLVLPSPSSESLNNYAHTLSVRAASYPGVTSVSQLDTLTAFTVPLDFMAGTYITTHQTQPGYVPVTITDNTNFLYHQHQISVDAKHGAGLITLDQATHPGWIAITTQQPWQKLDQVVFNGWQAAWVVPEGEWQILVLFWPQLLSYGGYVVLVVALLVALAFWKKDRNQQAISVSNFKRKLARVRTRLRGE